MVSYQDLTRLAFQLAENEGVEIETIEEGGETVSVVASIWNDRKDELKQMTEQQAYGLLREEIVW